jgi:hypothetical protein
MKMTDSQLHPKPLKIILIGTDHRLQQSVVRDEQTKLWVPRTGGQQYRKLIHHCIAKMGAKAILEEAHADQDRIASTIASLVARERGLKWISIGLGEPGLEDALIEPPLFEALQTRTKPEILAGIDNLKVQKPREEFMFNMIMDWAGKHGCVLAIVGFMHLGVLARQIDAAGVTVAPLIFTSALVVDETLS